VGGCKKLVCQEEGEEEKGEEDITNSEMEDAHVCVCVCVCVCLFVYGMR
jgi:hypothetical protein